MPAIVDTDLKVFLSAVMDDTTSNGGAMSATQATSELPNQIWPAVQKDERTAGSTKYRKIFHKNDNVDDVVLANGRVYLEAPTSGDGAVYLFPGTHTDTQAAITGSEDLYGAGNLDANVAALDATMDVAVEDGAVIIFRDGELVWIGDGTNEEFATIDGAPSVAGDIVTLTFAAGLVNSYLAAETTVASVIEHGDVEPTTTTPVVTSAGGAYSAASLALHNLGTIRQSWTITFTNATTFSCVGSVVGSVGSGNISSNFAPINPDTGTPYFTLANAGFSGTFATGNTIIFTTSPSAVPVWEKRVVPAGAAASSGNQAATVLYGESP